MTKPVFTWLTCSTWETHGDLSCILVHILMTLPTGLITSSNRSTISMLMMDPSTWMSKRSMIDSTNLVTTFTTKTCNNLSMWLNRLLTTTSTVSTLLSKKTKPSFNFLPWCSQADSTLRDASRVTTLPRLSYTQTEAQESTMSGPMTWLELSVLPHLVWLQEPTELTSPQDLTLFLSMLSLSQSTLTRVLPLLTLMDWLAHPDGGVIDQFQLSQSRK